MNRYAQDMLSRRGMRDGRNPYGSRGGYVVSGRGRGRDRAMSEDMARGRGRVRNNAMMGDYARGGRNDYNYGNDFARNDYAERGGQSDYRDYAEYDYAGSDMAHQQSGQYSADYGYEQDGHYGNYRPVEAMGYFNGYYDMGSDYDMRRDGTAKLSSKDIKKWEKELENADGTKGKKWDTDQIRQVAQQHGIRFDEYSPELLTAIANMLYSDYCKVLGADIMLYVKLAKAFLEDDDFDGDPEEKAMLYYKCIVSKDD